VTECLFARVPEKRPGEGRKGAVRIVDLKKSADLTDLVPSEFYLGQNYPNPFSGKTRIKFCVARKTGVKLQVFNSEGRMVKTLVDEEKEAGTYELEFSAEGIDTADLPVGALRLSEGVYVYQLQAGDLSETKQMLVVCPP
jgi:hypothetical protein